MVTNSPRVDCIRNRSSIGIVFAIYICRRNVCAVYQEQDVTVDSSILNVGGIFFTATLQGVQWLLYHKL